MYKQLQKLQDPINRISTTNTINDPSHIYLDLQITNNSISENDSTEKVLSFNETRTNQYLDCARDYYVSCVRFSLQSSLPCIIPQMDLDLTSSNITYDAKTIYWVGCSLVSNNATYATTQVLFVPENINVVQPTYKPTSIGDCQTNAFYYIRSPSSFLAMINTAITASCSTFGQGNNKIPQLVFDPTTNRIFFQENSITQRTINVFMNTALYNLFSSFPALTLGLKPPLNALANGNLHNNFQINFNSAIFNGANTILNQDFLSIPSWSPLVSIVFTTSLIPVSMTNISQPLIYGDNYQSNISSSNAITSNIITDFEFALTTGLEYQSILYYQPTSELRLFNLISNTPLANININVYFKNKFGQLIPLYIPSGGSCTLKLLFRKCSFNGEDLI